ncbi:hypothetical protein BC833DRAFT_584785 [Globomyces pollinis-pini]|nr:hypothetical protein BC833DRAFT_584785 [Globomyces pollinis-pini]
MTNSNIILDSLKDFQLELDKRNSNALLELNKHIDELATIPINTDLPLYSDSIEFISPPKGFADASSPTRNEDLSWQLRQDLEEFQKLSNNDFIPESRRESEDKSNNYNGYGAPSAPLEGLYIPQSFTSSSPLNTQYQPKLSSPINQNSHLLDNFDYNVERLSKSSNNIDTQNTTNSRAHSMENNYQSPRRNELDNEKIHTSYSKGYLSDRNIPVDQNNSAADAKLMNGSYRGDLHRNSFQNNEAVNSQFDLKSNNGYTSSIQNMNNAHISQDIYGSMVNNYNSLPSLNKKENPNYDPMSDFTNKLERIQNLQSPIQNQNTKLNRNSPQNSNFREEKLDLIDLDVGNQFSDVSSPFKPTEFLAEDNSRSIVNALRTLQDRVGKLEGEKLLAKEKINELENELLATRRLLYHKQKEGNPILMNDSTINPHFAKKELQDSSKLPVPQSTTDDTLNDIAEARKRVNELRKTVNRAGVYDNFNENTEMTDPSIDPILKGYQDVNDLYNSGPKLTTEDLKAKVVQQNRQTKGESDQDKLDDSVRRRSSIRNRESTRSRSINGRNSATQKRVSTEIPSPSQLDEVAKIQEWDTIKNNIKNVIAESKLNKKRQDQPVEMSQQVENVLDRPKSPLKSQQLNSKPNKEFINANNEMKKLHDDIEAEKNLRRMMISDLPKDFSSKEKIATKKKAETLKDSPSWKKSDRRSRSTFRDHTLSSSAHIRKRGPLEVPGVGLSEDNAGREMPFIVGKVFCLKMIFDL